jgi:hypothetical protein
MRARQLNSHKSARFLHGARLSEAQVDTILEAAEDYQS